MAMLSEQVEFGFIKSSPCGLRVMRISPSTVRPHAVDIGVHIIRYKSKVGEEIVTIGDDFTGTLKDVKNAIVRVFEAKGYVVERVSNLPRQLSRYHKRIEFINSSR